MPFMKNKVLYEQAPWDVEHINAIYPILKNIINDGQWHDYGQRNQIQRYRVFENKYFQVVVSKSDSTTLRQLCSIAAIDIDDDADWVVWEDAEGYVLSSELATTPGPFNDTSNTVDWLLKYNLGFEKHPSGMRGVAYFKVISENEILMAMKRLIWLEQSLISLNQQMSALSRNHWDEARSMLDDLPNQFEPHGHKRRQAMHET